ncbi:MAG: hypothetical protein FWH18_11755, partial [Marinilabiliaceae bacterium]|nr:hypothetical protein [Marinilabiliaceae bacterium]
KGCPYKACPRPFCILGNRKGCPYKACPRPFCILGNRKGCPYNVYFISFKATARVAHTDTVNDINICFMNNAG